jgi:hypothetical protein
MPRQHFLPREPAGKPVNHPIKDKNNQSKSSVDKDDNNLVKFVLTRSKPYEKVIAPIRKNQLPPVKHPPRSPHRKRLELRGLQRSRKVNRFGFSNISKTTAEESYCDHFLRTSFVCRDKHGTYD